MGANCFSEASSVNAVFQPACKFLVAHTEIVMGRFVLVSILLSLLVPPDHGRACDPQELLAKADRLAFLFSWPRAGRLYAEAETLFA